MGLNINSDDLWRLAACGGVWLEFLLLACFGGLFMQVLRWHMAYENFREQLNAAPYSPANLAQSAHMAPLAINQAKWLKAFLYGLRSLREEA